MAAKGTRHSVGNSRLLTKVVMLIGEQAIVRVQEPIIIPPDSEPEPDVVIARNKSDNYLSNHPNPADLLLVIEVADSSLKYDQEVKLALYAEARISNYWIFNLVTNCLEAYSESYQDQQDNFGYAHKHIFLPNSIVILPCFPELSLSLTEVFPQAES